MIRFVCLPLFILLSSISLSADLDSRLQSEARQALIEEFEQNGCRLTLMEISDLLFDYDTTEQMIYTERMVIMEPEEPSLSFPVVLTKSAACESTVPIVITVPEQALHFARQALQLQQCSMSLADLELLEYPKEAVGPLQDTDKRNIVSELYNRDVITFEYVSNDGVNELRAILLADSCDPNPQ